MAPCTMTGVMPRSCILALSRLIWISRSTPPTSPTLAMPLMCDSSGTTRLSMRSKRSVEPMFAVADRIRIGFSSTDTLEIIGEIISRGSSARLAESRFCASVIALSISVPKSKETMIIDMPSKE